MEGKLAFEWFCQSHGIQVQHYHADNGIFASNTWRLSCQEQSQGLSFIGVGAHHQNGVIEQRIWELQEMMQTILIHMQHQWSSAILANLWPYALQMVTDALNATPHLKFKDGKTPLESKHQDYQQS